MGRNLTLALPARLDFSLGHVCRRRASLKTVTTVLPLLLLLVRLSIVKTVLTYHPVDLALRVIHVNTCYPHTLSLSLSIARAISPFYHIFHFSRY
jgi:hypothetical protein